ncbi:hypothetical protein OU792_17690 [Algoriphagus sp. NF]|uniref:hypothetical protein n=1 Tax=Algoriphagus sp. NF TaxID=2992756 RepID=UPI00237C44E2|nr:hypothetical protein [Algoriphagus sp. NF]MDE0561834.1 hypothetical protein [Algoriphagus sp. NF]
MKTLIPFTKKIWAVAALLFLGLGTLQAETNSHETNLERPLKVEEISIEISERIPTIILVDKNLDIVAQFYGNTEEVKLKFKDTFQKSEKLIEHNGQKIYLLTN